MKNIYNLIAVIVLVVTAYGCSRESRDGREKHEQEIVEDNMVAYPGRTFNYKQKFNDLQQKQSRSDYAPIATIAPLAKGKQMQWMVGLDYTLDKNAWLSLNFGMVSVENTYNMEAANVGESVNLPAYAKNFDGTWPAQFTSEFTQTIVEASINVEF